MALCLSWSRPLLRPQLEARVHTGPELEETRRALLQQKVTLERASRVTLSRLRLSLSLAVEQSAHNISVTCSSSSSSV